MKNVNRYVTKYALTEGIGFRTGDIIDGYFYYGSWSVQVAPKDHFVKLEDAVERAEELRAKKIKSLKKQIVKLKAKEFGKAFGG